MLPVRHTVTITTDASGDAIAYTTDVVNGRILSIQYVKNNFDNGVDFTVSGKNTALAIWAESDVNASATRAPRQATHSAAGVAALYAASGTAVNDHIAIANEQIKIVVAQGGNVKSGTLHITVG